MTNLRGVCSFAASLWLVMLLLDGCSHSGIKGVGLTSPVSISNDDYAVAYDYNEVRTATAQGGLPVEAVGTPFADLPTDMATERLLPLMQTSGPRTWPTFVSKKPGRESRPPYRLVLVFTPPPDLGAGRVCRGEARAGAPVSGWLVVFAVYCRNDRPMSQALARTTVRGADDPAVRSLFKQLLAVVFSDAPIIEPVHGYPGGLQ